MAQSPLSAPKLTEIPFSQESVVSAIQAHHDKIAETIDGLLAGNITQEALEDVRERGRIISGFAVIAMRIRERCAA